MAHLTKLRTKFRFMLPFLVHISTKVGDVLNAVATPTQN